MSGITPTQQQYKILIEQDGDGYFVASVPILPGCHTQAKTIPELSKRIKEAILLCLDVAKKNPQYRKKIQMFAYEPTFIGMETVTV
jgi:predicted RNase H-like HicB family nuclease